MKVNGFEHKIDIFPCPTNDASPAVEDEECRHWVFKNFKICAEIFRCRHVPMKGSKTSLYPSVGYPYLSVPPIE